MLLEDGGEVGLGHIVGEGAVAEDTLRFARRDKLPANVVHLVFLMLPDPFETW